MKDYIVRATAGNAQIRAFAAVTTELTERLASVMRQVLSQRRLSEDCSQAEQ